MFAPPTAIYVHATYKHFGDLVTCDKLMAACPNRD